MKLVKFCCACAAIALSSSAFSQVDEITIIGNKDSGGSTGTTGVYREQSTPANPSAAEGKAMRDKQKKVSEETAKAREKAKNKCLDDAAIELNACYRTALDDYGWNMGVCNYVIGMPAAALTGAGIYSALQNKGWKGKVVAGLGSSLVYGAVACKDHAAITRDGKKLDCDIDNQKTKSTKCNF